MRQTFEYHPTVGFRYIPGLKARVPHEGGGYLLRANSTGFRNDFEFERRKTPDKRRILLFGDSYTAGEGVSNGHRYSDHLQHLMPDLEVYNFGVNATGTDQHYLIYREFAAEIEHDAQVIAVFVENIRRVGSRYRWFTDDSGRPVLYAKPYFTVEDDELVLRGVPPDRRPVDPASLDDEERRHIATTVRFPRLRRAFERMRQRPWFERVVVRSGLKDRLLKLVSYQPIPEYSDPAHPSWRIMRAVLENWIREHEKPTLVMPIPVYHYVAGLADPRPYQARLREAAEAAGGQFFDPLAALTQHSPQDQRSFFYERDGHLTARGNAALAAAMVPALERMFGASEVHASS